MTGEPFEFYLPPRPPLLSKLSRRGPLQNGLPSRNRWANLSLGAPDLQSPKPPNSRAADRRLNAGNQPNSWRRIGHTALGAAGKIPLDPGRRPSLPRARLPTEMEGGEGQGNVERTQARKVCRLTAGRSRRSFPEEPGERRPQEDGPIRSTNGENPRAPESEPKIRPPLGFSSPHQTSTRKQSPRKLQWKQHTETRLQHPHSATDPARRTQRRRVGNATNARKQMALY